MSRIYLLSLILLILAVSGCTLQFDEPVNNTTNNTPVITPTPEFAVRESSTVYVSIKGAAFDPLELKVVNGTIVKWENFDSSNHAINVNNFSSPTFYNRGNWSYRFNETGTFEYNCSVHPWMKHGRVIVE